MLAGEAPENTLPTRDSTEPSTPPVDLGPPPEDDGADSLLGGGAAAAGGSAGGGGVWLRPLSRPRLGRVLAAGWLLGAPECHQLIMVTMSNDETNDHHCMFLIYYWLRSCFQTKLSEKTQIDLSSILTVKFETQMIAIIQCIN